MQPNMQPTVRTWSVAFLSAPAANNAATASDLPRLHMDARDRK